MNCLSSSVGNIRCEVPQGSCIGSLIFSRTDFLSDIEHRMNYLVNIRELLLHSGKVTSACKPPKTMHDIISPYPLEYCLQSNEQVI